MALWRDTIGPRKGWVPLQAQMKHALVMSLETSVGQEGLEVTLAGWYTLAVPGQPGVQSKTASGGQKKDEKEGWTVRGEGKKE